MYRQTMKPRKLLRSHSVNRLAFQQEEYLLQYSCLSNKLGESLVVHECVGFLKSPWKLLRTRKTKEE